MSHPVGDADVLHWRLLAAQVPSPADVEGWTTGIERGGIVFVLVTLTVILGGLALRTMLRTEARVVELEKRNTELVNLLLVATSEAERGGRVVREQSRRLSGGRE